METINLALFRYLGGFTYIEISEFLRVRHGYVMNLSTLKRWFREKGMIKRPLEAIRNDTSDILEAVRDELSGSGADIGYRRIHKALKWKGYIWRRDDVRQIVKQLNPDSIKLRKRRRLHRRRYVADGPNFVWHFDGHDKLKPFGFSIHGCIDGFSRYLIWIEVTSSNKKPELIAKFYLDAVKSLEGIPLQIKADNGTEHFLIEPMHLHLSTLNGNLEINHFSIITSPQNQRIESYWSVLQRDRLGWWRRFFQDLVDLELLNTKDPVVLDCIYYCFMGIIRQELNSVKEDWNSHIISSPTGRPSCMYYLPHLYDKKDCVQKINKEEIEEFDSVIGELPSGFTTKFSAFSRTIIPNNGIKAPTNPSEALNLYLYLLEKIDQYS